MNVEREAWSVIQEAVHGARAKADKVGSYEVWRRAERCFVKVGDWCMAPLLIQQTPLVANDPLFGEAE